MSNRIIAYCPLHYGIEYLSEAIKAVEPFVEKIVMLYTSKPSYGYNTQLVCPDSEDELRDIALSASNKVQWHNIQAYAENQHRGLIYKIAQEENFDGILTFDADEILEPADIASFIETAMVSDKRYIGVSGYINFFKSFNWCCYDGFEPIRFINLHRIDGQGSAKCRIYHFSTAQRLDIMKYKLEIHGHKVEIRPNWLNDVYLRWEPGMTIDKGLHLVSHDLWNAVSFDKNELPLLLKQHPNFQKEVIM